MILDDVDHLAHYGTLRKSGRYPYGSGGNPAQRQRGFLEYVDSLHAKGMSDTEIYRGLGMTSTEFRNRRSIARNEEKQAKIDMAQRLKDKSYSNVAIGERMGINESSVRALLAPGQKTRANILQTIASKLKDEVDSGGFIQIGTGVENYLNVSATRLRTAVSKLQELGYKVHSVQVDQLGTSVGKKTLVKVLTPPGTTYRDVITNTQDIRLINA